MFTILLLGIIVMAASSSQSMDIHFLQLQRVRNPENAKHLLTLTHTEKTEFRQCACGIFAFCSRVAQVGSWQICLWTIKVLHRVGSRREPRCPVILDILQTAWTSCRAVCATDGWSLELTSLFFFSWLAPSSCLITITTWEWGCVSCCVCVREMSCLE